MRPPTTKLREEKGAASVLVILIMVVFCLLGLLAMVYAQSNYALSQKTLAWQKEYYALDAAGEAALQEIDALLQAALDEAENPQAYSSLSQAALYRWLTESAPGIMPLSAEDAPSPHEEEVFAFSIEGEEKRLEIILALPYPPAHEGITHTILSWQLKQPAFVYTEPAI